MRNLFAFTDAGVAVLVEPMVGHDPEQELARTLVDAFVLDLKARLAGRSIGAEEARKSVVGACATAFEAFRSCTDEGQGGLVFTVVTKSTHGWLVLNLGANVVLHLVGGEARLVLEPQSVMQEGLRRGVDREHAAVFAGTSSAVAVEGRPFEQEIQSAMLELHRGEWLLAAAGSDAALDLTLTSQPESLEEVAAVVEQLGQPFAQYPRTWLAIGPGE